LVSSTCSALREKKATSQPSCANSSSARRPMPRLPPGEDDFQAFEFEIHGVRLLRLG
jgi:hypothetical protein